MPQYSRAESEARAADAEFEQRRKRFLRTSEGRKWMSEKESGKKAWLKSPEGQRWLARRRVEEEQAEVEYETQFQARLTRARSCRND